MLGAPPPGGARSKTAGPASRFQCLQSLISQPGIQVRGGLTLSFAIIGLVCRSAVNSSSSEFSCRSDYCGLLTNPASTTCSPSAPAASDKLSSQQIETNDRPLHHSPTAQLWACPHVHVCIPEKKTEGENKETFHREGGTNAGVNYILCLSLWNILV